MAIVGCECGCRADIHWLARHHTHEKRTYTTIIKTYLEGITDREAEKEISDLVQSGMPCSSKERQLFLMFAGLLTGASLIILGCTLTGNMCGVVRCREKKTETQLRGKSERTIAGAVSL